MSAVHKFRRSLRVTVCAASIAGLVAIATPASAASDVHVVMQPTDTQQVSIADQISIADQTKITLDGATSLQGLEKATHLEVLTARYGSITDLTPLKNLTHLKVLILTGNTISDVSPIKDLHLDGLDLAQNTITSLAALRDMPAPRYANFNYNRITDVSPLDHWQQGDSDLWNALSVRGQGIPSVNDDSTFDDAVYGGTIYASLSRRSAAVTIDSVTGASNGAVEYFALGDETSAVQGNAVSWSTLSPGTQTLLVAFQETREAPFAFGGTLGFRVEWVADWSPTGRYAAGTRVMFDGHMYIAAVSSQGYGDANWINSPALWAKAG